MNYAVCIFFSALAVVLCVSKFFISGEKWAKIDKTLCIVLASCGVISFAAFLTSSLIKSGNGEWASGVVSGYLKDVLPALGIVVLLVVLSGIFQPSKYPLRAVVVALSSILILVYGEIASYLAAGGDVSVTTEIRGMSASLSAALCGAGYFDYRYLLREKFKK